MSIISHDPSARQFTTEVDGRRAQLDYTLAGRAMTVTHTRVPEEIGGRGIAAELMSAALSTARSAGWTVTPACSYAAAYMAKHPQGAEQGSAERSPEQRHVDDLLDEALDESFPASDSPSVGGSS
jgi:hypothetical protein